MALGRAISPTFLTKSTAKGVDAIAGPSHARTVSASVNGEHAGLSTGIRGAGLTVINHVHLGDLLGLFVKVFLIDAYLINPQGLVRAELDDLAECLVQRGGDAEDSSVTLQFDEGARITPAIRKCRVFDGVLRVQLDMLDARLEWTVLNRLGNCYKADLRCSDWLVSVRSHS